MTQHDIRRNVPYGTAVVMARDATHAPYAPENDFLPGHAAPRPEKDAIGANATVTVKRTDFNLDKQAAHVGDDMKIDVAVEAIRG
jgi:hypothetical protein